MSPYALATTSLLVITLCVAIIASFFLLLFIASLIFSDKKSFSDKIKRKGVLVFLFAVGASLGLAICGLTASVIWWISIWFYHHGSPAWLFALSVVFGVAPLIISQLAALLAKLLGGGVDASGAAGCYILGRNIGPLVYHGFMLYTWSIFTFGLAFIGLMLSVVWLF